MNRDIESYVLFFAALISSFFAGYQTADLKQPDIIEFPQAFPYQYTTVGCGSYSMGLSFKCNDMVVTTNNYTLEEGNMYIYRGASGENTILHRLVKDCREGCTGLIFKGDNNLYADEVVNESQVLNRITGVVYDGRMPNIS